MAARRELAQPDAESLLVALGRGEAADGGGAGETARAAEATARRDEAGDDRRRNPRARAEIGVSVEGMEGMLTRLATCCSPLPGDDLYGFVTRGRGVVIHRADCPNLRALLGAPARARDHRELAEASMAARRFRAPIIVEGTDRTGLLRDVTGVISGAKINMLRDR